MNKFEDAVSAALKDCSRTDVFLAAVSGGADSMAMLVALHELFPASIHCLHVEHGIRPPNESGGDAEFVRSFCERYKIDCQIVHIQPGKIVDYARQNRIGIEAAARFFRYEALGSYAAKLKETCILTGHTKDDLLETVLMRFLRGSAPGGLAGIKNGELIIKNSEFEAENRLPIIRPLLSLTRSDVINYLKAKEVSWREDITNSDDIFLRNKIRNRLVPLLDDNFPTWRTGVAAVAQTQLLVADFIVDEAQNRIKWEINDTTYSTCYKNFFAQSPIIREEAVFLVIDELLKGLKISKTIKRTVVRKFCSGTVNAADLGLVRISRKGKKVLLSGHTC